MRLNVLPLEFKQAEPIIAKLEAAGFEAYFVGGSVRDSLLNKPIHDVDIATSAYPAEVKELFPRTVDIGIEHGTVLVLENDLEYEITTFRTESLYQDYRRPSEVTFVRSLKEDLKRRDFTINALAMNKAGEIVDLFNGQGDLANELIRAVGDPRERFNEDALRMMRALRFASQLDFDIEGETLKAIYQNHHLLSKISVERIRIEYLKLMAGKNRQKGLLPLVETNCYRYCPEMKNAQKELLKLSQLPQLSLREEAQIWLLTVFTLGLNRDNVTKFMVKWKNSKHMSSRVTLLLKGLTYRLENQWSRPWLFKLGLENLALIEETLPFLKQESQLEETLAAYNDLPIKKMQDLAIDGKALITLKNNQGGPWVGELLSELKLKVLADELANNKEALIAYAKEQLAI